MSHALAKGDLMHLCDSQCDAIQYINRDLLCLGYPDSEDRILNRVISDISVVLWETTLTVSESTETVSPVESEIVRMVSLSTTEIAETIR